MSLDTGALTRVSVLFALKKVLTAPVAPIMTKLFDAAGPPSSVGALADALGITLEPSVLLAGALGRFSVPRVGAGATVTSLSATYIWDMHHEQRVSSVEDLRRRAVSEWSAGFGDAIAEIEAALRERFGASRASRAVENGRAPRLGGWWLKAQLCARPTGGKWGKSEDGPGPPGGTPVIGSEDFVELLEIRPI